MKRKKIFLLVIIVLLNIVVFNVKAVKYQKGKFVCDSDNNHNNVPCEIKVTYRESSTFYDAAGNETRIKKSKLNDVDIPLYCVEHEQNAPAKGERCLLKYDNYVKSHGDVLAALGAAMSYEVNGTSPMDLNISNNHSEYLKIQLDLNDILYYHNVYVNSITRTYSKSNQYFKAGMEASTKYNGNLLFNLSNISSENSFEISNVKVVKDFEHGYSKTLNNITEYDIKAIKIGDEELTKDVDYTVEKTDNDKKRRVTITNSSKINKNNKVEVTIKFTNTFNYAALYLCTGQDVAINRFSQQNVKKTLTAKKTIEFEISDCARDFNGLSDKSMFERYKLYKKYGSVFNNLLDLNIDDGSSACSTKSCNRNYEKACLYYKSDYNLDDFSCYSDVLEHAETNNGVVSYNLNYICTTGITLSNNLGFENDELKLFRSIPGRTISYVNRENSSIPVGGTIGNIQLFKNCYVVNNDTFIDFSKQGGLTLNYIDEYLDNVKFNNMDLETKINSVVKQNASVDDSETIIEENVVKNRDFVKVNDRTVLNNSQIDNDDNLQIKVHDNNEFIWFNYDVVVPTRYLEIGTGKLVNSYSSSIYKYRETNNLYSEISTRHTANIENSDIPFEINFKTNIDFENYKTSSSEGGKCIYDKSYSDGELFNYCENCNNLNLEFRIIDTDNPFLNMDGTVRNTMYNWCDRTGNLLSCSYNNKVSEQYIKGNTNSYNKKYELDSDGKATTKIDGDGPKYKITLTPEVMSYIKERAKERNITYNNFKLRCSSSSCISYLLTDLINKKDSNDNPVLKINYTTKR